METLINLQESFAAWRASSSSSKKRHTDLSLRIQAVKCLDHHTYREISAAIGMSVNSLRSWEKSLHQGQESRNNPLGFIPVNLNHAQDIESVPHAALSLQISLPSGISIQVNSASMKSSVALIIALNKESQSCSI